MKTIPFDLGDGKVIVLERSEELARLTRGRRALVTQAIARIFESPTRELEALATTCGVGALTRWLRRAACAEVTLEIYETRDFGELARLCFDFGPYDARPARFGSHRVRIDGDSTPPPEHCPSALREVLGAIGGVSRQVGASGTILSPSELSPLASTPSWAHLLEDLSDADAQRLVPFCEHDGDALCYEIGTGATRWLGAEWSANDSPRPVDDAIEDLFEGLLRKDWCWPHVPSRPTDAT